MLSFTSLLLNERFEWTTASDDDSYGDDDAEAATEIMSQTLEEAATPPAADSCPCKRKANELEQSSSLHTPPRFPKMKMRRKSPLENLNSNGRPKKMSSPKNKNSPPPPLML